MSRISTLLAFAIFSFAAVPALAQAPATQATNVVFSPNIHVNPANVSLTIGWTQGEASNKLVVISSGTGSFTPLNGVDYSSDANTIFTSATNKSTTGGESRIVFTGTGNSVPVTALAASTYYTVQVYQFNPTGFLYNTLTATGNPRTAWFLASGTSIPDYQVPAGVTSITVQAWGGGGAGGGSGSTTNGRAGGGGGAYVTGTLATSGGTNFTAVIGAGGPASEANGTATTFGGAGTFSADFGIGGASAGDDPGEGGTTAASTVSGTSTNEIAGSNGAVRSSPSGGAGGNAGNAAGTGGAAGSANNNGGAGSVPGGGGGGAGTNSEGGAGANGMVIVHNTTPIVQPGTQATNIAFSSITTTSMQVSWTKGNGANVLVLAHSGAAVDANPVDATGYTANAAFTSGTQIGTGNYVVYSGSGTNVNVTGLTAGTIYHFRVYEFNGGTGTFDYNTNTATGNPASQSTLVAAPSLQPATMTFSNITSSAMRVSYGTAGNGTARVLVAKSGSAVSANPVNGTTYSPDGNFGTPAIGTSLGTGNIVVGLITSGAAGFFDVTNLSPSTTYHYALFEFNGTGGSQNYLTTAPLTGSQATAVAEPSQATNITFSNITTTSIQVSWTTGNGTDALVLAHAGAAVDADPADFNGYTDNAAFTTGDQIGTGNYVVYKGTGTSVTVTGLTANTVYHFRVYEFNGAGATANYNVNTATGNPASRTTVVAPPAVQPQTMTFTSVATTSMTVNYATEGDGTARILVGRAGSAVSAIPVNGTAYTPDGNYGTPAVGTDLGSGNIVLGVVTSTAGGSFNITGLSSSTTYHFALYEFTGTGAASSYLTAAPLIGDQATVATAPGTQASDITFTSITDASMSVNWTNGNGARRLVIARFNAAVATNPTDFTNYTASSDWNNGTPSGTAIGAGFVVYDGTGTFVSITNMVPGTYHFRVYEYNGASTTLGAFNVNTATGNPNSQITAAQASNITFGTPTTNSIPFSWTNGGGTNRIAIVKTAGAAFTPVNGTTYAPNANFSTNPNDLNNAAPGIVRCVFNGAGTTQTVTNLTVDDNSYDFQIYEYIGAPSAEVYFLSSGTGNPANRHTIESTEPSNQATAGAFSSISASSITFQVTTLGASPGASRMIVVSNAAIGFNPTDGVSYVANTDFSAGTDLDGGANIVKVVGYGSGPIAVTGLSGDVTYFFAAYEFNGAQGSGAENYRDTEFETSRNTSPTSQVDNITFSATSQTGMTINWLNGNGDRTLVLIHEGAAVDADPVNQTLYGESADWNMGAPTGAQIGIGNYVLLDAATSTNNVAITNLLPNTTYHFRVYDYNAFEGGSIGTTTADAAYLTPGASGSHTTTACVYPTAPTTLTSSTTSSTLILGWARSVNTDNSLVVVIPGPTPPSAPIDGIDYATGANLNFSTSTSLLGGGKVVFANESHATNLGQGVTVTGLTQSTQYSFAIYTFNNTTRCYQPTALTGTVSTTGPQPELTLAGATSEPASVTFSTSSPGNFVFDFTVEDPGTDGIDAVITSITINRLDQVSGDIDDWTQAIAGARLSDGTNTQTTTAGVNSIVFSGIASALGTVTNGTNKTYTLTVWLHTSLGGTLPTDIDGKNFVFGVGNIAGNNNSFIFAGGSSTLAPTQSQNSGTTNDVVDIVATQLVFTQQPPAAALAAVALSPQPILQARDANNNLDLASISATVSTPDATLNPTSAPAGFTNGVMNFTSSGFNYASTGNSRLTVTTTSPALSVTSTQSTNVTASTSVAQLLGGIAPGFDLNSSATDQALLGFSLTTSGSTLDFTGLTVSTNMEPDGKIKNIELVSSTTNNYSTGVLTVLATGTTPGNAINFTGFTASINSTPTFYFIRVDVEDNVNGLTPSIELTLTPDVTNVVVSGGSSVTGGAFSGTEYTFIDVTNPTILSITNGVDPININNLTQAVIVVFSERMNTGFAPNVTLTTGGFWNFTGGSWSMTNVLNDTYTATFDHDGSGETIPAETSAVVGPFNTARDFSNNLNLAGATSAPFVVDTQRPVATVTVDTNPIYTGDLTQTVTVQYNESMNNSTSPTITFGTSTHFTPTGPGVWGTTTFANDTWTRTFLHDGTAETITSETAVVANNSGAQDAAGNTDIGDATPPIFQVDTKAPELLEIFSTLAGLVNRTTGQVVQMRMHFDASIVVTGVPTLTLNSGGTATFVGISGGTDAVFNYTVLAGHNASDLDVTAINMAGATIRDAVTNNAILTIPPGENLADNEDINVDTQAPAVVSVSSTASDGTYKIGNTLFFEVAFTENVNVTGIPQLALNSGGTALYNSGTGTSTLTFRYDIAVGQNSTDLDYVNISSLTLPVGAFIRDVVNINANLTLAAPGTLNSISDNQDIEIDGTYPTASTIDINTVSTPTEGWSIANGTSSSTLTWEVTFSEDVGVVDVTDFVLQRGPGLTIAVPNASLTFNPLTNLDISGSGNTRTVTLTGVKLLQLSSDAQLRLSINDDNSITDIAGNPLGGPAPDDGDLNSVIAYPGSTSPGFNDYYTILFPEPSDPATGLVVSAQTPYDFSVAWSDPSPATAPPNLYYFELKTSSASFNSLPDGFYAPDADNDFSDGTLGGYFFSGNFPGSLAINNYLNPSMAPFLNSGITYDIRVTAIGYSGFYSSQLQFDYLNSPVLTGTGTTTTASTTTVSPVSTNNTISSMATALSGAVAPQQNAVTNFTFSITDDGASPGSDNAPFKFSTIVIKEGTSTGIPIGDWTQAIASAELSDGINPPVVVTNSAVTTAPNTITFPVNPATVGLVGDNGIKNYTLRITLRTGLGGTLPIDIDGKNFVFWVDNTSFSYDNTNQTSSTLLGTSSAESISNRNVVNVTASAFAFTTQPIPTTILVQTNFSTSPVARAVDGNGNVDRTYNGAAFNVSITNTGLLPMIPGGTHPITLTPSLGVVTFPAGFQYTNAGNGTLTVSRAGVNSNAGSGFVACDPVTVNYSNLSTITSGTGVTRVLSTETASPGVPVFSFTYNDDGGTGLGDGANTEIDVIKITPAGANELDWSLVLNQASLTDGTNTVVASSIDATGITFSGPVFTSSALSTVVDGATSASKTYTLNVWFKTDLGSLAATADQDHLVFSMSTNPTNLTLATASSQAPVAAPVNSGAGNGLFEVDATQLIFTTDFSGSLTMPPVPPNAHGIIDFLVNTSTTAQSFSNPVVQAVDINGNRDTDYSSPVTVTAAGGMTLSNPLASVTSGVGTFPGSFQYDATGAGKLTVSTSTANRVAVAVAPTTNANAQTVNVKTGTASKIDAASTIAAGSISSITNASSGQVVFTFRLDDDPAGTPALQNDGNPTLVSKIVIRGASANNTIIDWSQVIAGARLEDAGNATKFVDLLPSDISSSTLTFNGITFTSGELGYIADDATKTYNLKIWLKTNLAGTQNYNKLIDGLTFGFDLLSVDITTDPTGTSFLPSQQANAVNGSTTVNVNATRIDFITPDPASSPISASLNVDFQVMVEAHDVNGNLDQGFSSPITDVTNETDADMEGNGIAIGTAGSGIEFGVTAFSGGQFTFPASFRFTSGANDDEVTLKIEAGGIFSLDLPAGAATTPFIKLSSSFESVLVVDPGFFPVFNIPYINNQNIAAQATSFPVAQFKLFDGNGSTNDSDGANTNIDDITFSVTNPENVRSLGIYLGSTLIQSRDNATFTGGSVTFNNLFGSLIATDNSSLVFTVRASFFNSAAQITDNEEIRLQVTAVTQSGGSQFNNVVANPIGGVTNGAVSAAGMRIEVLATQLDFTTQPADFEGINQPITEPVVAARDANGVVDLDQDPSINTIHGFISTPAAGVSIGSFPFALGIMNFPGLQYTSTGNGTLTIATLNEMGSLIQGTSDPVDVIHVTASQNINGVVTATNLKRGSTDVVIFGVTFNVPHKTSGHPELKEFSFIFNNPYETQTTTTFKNFRVFESTNGIFTGSTLVTTIGGAITKHQSPLTVPGTPAAVKDMITVKFANPGDYRNLHGSTSLTYYLMADVDAQVNISTPKMKVQLIDGGFGSATNSSIVITEGSSVANLESQEYSFASTRAPSLVDSNPRNGQLNVDPARNEIKLIFDVGVWSLDGKAKLYDRQNNKLIATLDAVNGRYQQGDPVAGSVLNPDSLTFSIPPGVVLKHDSVYYLTIEKGTFDPISDTGKGISDDGYNLFGGISYNGILYFKIASEIAPKMVETEPLRYYVTETGGTINAAFDQFGKGYFMVVDVGDPVPTNEQIKTTGTGYTGTEVARGVIDIKQVYPKVQFGSFEAALTPGQYDVWMYAENDALPDPVPTDDPYGPRTSTPATSFIEGTGTAGNPTFKISVAAGTPSLYLNNPTYTICSGDNANTLADPIIIGEGSPGQFNLGAQDFNILLPPGFEFDTDSEPEVALQGLDFTPSSFAFDFLGGSVLNISYSIQSIGNLDKIIITNLRVRGNIGATGDIKRFSGNAIPALGNIRIASISAVTDPAPTFINTFALNNDFSSIGISSDVTAIPDNFIDKTLGSNQSAVRLIPIVPPGDYGASFFNGSGVTNDLLSLSGVQLNSAFDITMTHTNMNGCISAKTEQYEVYDHLNAIPALIDATYGPKACIENPGYLQGNAPPLLVDPSKTIEINGKAGYNLLELYASIPARATKLDSTLSANDPTAQIMHGSVWQDSVSNIPVEKVSTTLGKSFNWEYSKLLPLHPSLDPYKYFNELTPNGRTYYTGGSLGLVEFTGKYQSTADGSILVPIRQEIEIFIPAIPVVELSEVNQPVKGTAVYCESGGAITISGYPAASSGASTGTFTLSSSGGGPIPNYPGPAFVDNGNGTATLYPFLLNAGNNVGITNGYNEITITYVYQDNNSPCPATAETTLRITPNPVAQFTAQSVIGLNTPVATAYCKNSPINFNASTSSVSVGTISTYKWNFNDAANTSSGNLNEVEGDATVAQNVPHRFATSARYNVSLIVTSNFGCASTEEIEPIDVGAIPVVKFSFLGVSTEDLIEFDINASVDSSQLESAPIVNDRFDRLVWNYDHGTPLQVTSNFRNAVTHNYPDPGQYDVNLEITSRIGCRNSRTQPIIVLARESSSASNAYYEDFENGDGDWQPSSLPTNSNTVNPYSWDDGTPSTPVITVDPSINGNSVWKTSLTGTYNPRERSALYSPSIDISELARPMISFNSFTQMENSDGIVLEYSTDNKNVADSTKRWDVLGRINEGVDWFTDQSILAKPGNQTNFDFGWSGSDITQWKESKHGLTNEPGKAPLIGAANVVFRFALASAKADASALDGFAVDNFRVGNRTRIVLLENFRNLGNAASDNRGIIEKVEADSFYNFNPSGTDSSVVKINYHVAFPNQDPLNRDNEQDPGAKALYYNVSQTPRLRMDGETVNSGNPLFSAWGPEMYNVRSLKLADAKMKINATKNSDGVVDLSIDVTALRNLPPQTILNVAIVEQAVDVNMLSDNMQSLVQTTENRFEYVLKKLLPTAAGTRFDQPLQTGTLRTFGPFTWEKTVRLYDPIGDLSVVVFLQNEDTREIYQTEIAEIDEADVITGIEDINASFHVYPNPADREMTIELPATATKRTTLKMYDQMGKVVEDSFFETGESSKTIGTESHAAGVYLIQIESEKGMLRRKVMVVHKN